MNPVSLSVSALLEPSIGSSILPISVHNNFLVRCRQIQVLNHASELLTRLFLQTPVITFAQYWSDLMNEQLTSSACSWVTTEHEHTVIAVQRQNLGQILGCVRFGQLLPHRINFITNTSNNFNKNLRLLLLQFTSKCCSILGSPQLFLN